MHLKKLVVLVFLTGGMIFIRIFPLITLARWRPLEAALAAIGSQSESILDCIEDEQASGRTAPIDVEYLLANIIPPILGASGRCFFTRALLI